MGSSHVTIRDIAEHCHVSVATVSRALNGRSGVSTDLRNDIVAYAAQCNYVPNQTARSMRSRQSGIVYIIVRRTKQQGMPFQIPTSEGLKEMLGLDVRLHTLSFDADLIDDIRAFEARTRPRLLVIAGPCLVRDLSRFRTIQTPLLFVLSDDAPEGYPRVMSDDFDGTKALTESIIEAGHRRIAVITDDNACGQPNYKERIRGYRAALSAHHIDFNPSIIYSLHIDYVDYLASVERMATAHVLPVLQRQIHQSTSRPTAILVLSDFIAFALMRVLWNGGYRVPKDLSMASFGGWDLTKYISVSIHSWVQPVQDLLFAVFTAISSLINGDPFTDHLELPMDRPNGHHGIAQTVGPTSYIIPGYLRSGQSLGAPNADK